MTGDNMSMKLQDLHKNKMLKTGNAMKQVGTPDRFGGNAPAPDRKEQRKLDQAAGLIPFACKLPMTLVTQLNEKAREDGIALNDLLKAMLEDALSMRVSKASPADAKTAAPAKKAVAKKTTSASADESAAEKKPAAKKVAKKKAE
jgi:hypothetical protein